MMTTQRRGLGLIALLTCLNMGCQEQVASESQNTPYVNDAKDDSSVAARFFDFEFDAQVTGPRFGSPERIIESQLLYTIGHLDRNRAVGRLDNLRLSNIKTEILEDESAQRISYHAVMTVAWASDDTPSRYEFKLPKDVRQSQAQTFIDRYWDGCTDWHANEEEDKTPGIWWYYYRPLNTRCEIQDEDVSIAYAAVTPSPVETHGRYPEYHKIWEDGVFKATLIVGSYEAGATSNLDSGIGEYNELVAWARNNLSNLEMSPADVSINPGFEAPIMTFKGELEEGYPVEITMLLHNGSQIAGWDHSDLYTELSKDADYIDYSGHSGLGRNIRALAREGDWQPEQYVIVFMNGCNTYAYIDSALFDAHRVVNPDDVEGTQYMDIIMNAMPASTREGAESTLEFVKALARPNLQKSYADILRGIDDYQVALVSGEHDNVYTPESDYNIFE